MLSRDGQDAILVDFPARYSSFEKKLFAQYWCNDAEYLLSASSFCKCQHQPLKPISLDPIRDLSHVLSPSPPPQNPVKGNKDFYYGSHIQPESPEDPAQQVRVKGIGLQMPSRPPRGGQIGWGSGWLYHCFFFLLPWQRATHTHTSLQEVLQVKARFNGCFSDSLSESSLFGGVTEVLTDCKSSDKEQSILLGLVSDPRRFTLFCGCIWHRWPCQSLIYKSESLFLSNWNRGPRFLKADTLVIRGSRPTANHMRCYQRQAGGSPCSCW